MESELPVCVDFDGTCVIHEYPKIGDDVPGSIETLQWMNDNGFSIILFTMRSGMHLIEALGWFQKNKINVWGVQTNPSQSKWTESPKAYGKLYIDDAAFGCPLIKEEGRRPYVDWSGVKEKLIELKK